MILKQKILKSAPGSLKHWTREEKKNIIKAVAEHGKEWTIIQQIVNPHRTVKAYIRKVENLRKQDLDPDYYEDVEKFMEQLTDTAAIIGGKDQWTDEETQALVTAVAKYGRDWLKVQKIVNFNRSKMALRKKAKNLMG